MFFLLNNLVFKTWLQNIILWIKVNFISIPNMQEGEYTSNFHTGSYLITIGMIICHNKVLDA